MAPKRLFTNFVQTVWKPYPYNNTSRVCGTNSILAPDGLYGSKMSFDIFGFLAPHGARQYTILTQQYFFGIWTFLDLQISQVQTTHPQATKRPRPSPPARTLLKASSALGPSDPVAQDASQIKIPFKFAGQVFQVRLPAAAPSVPPRQLVTALQVHATRKKRVHPSSRRTR